MHKIFKQCSLYQKPNGYFLFRVKRTDYGGISQVPAIQLPRELTALQLGEAVLPFLNTASGLVESVDLSADMAAFRAHLKELGFKTVSAFEQKAAVAGVNFDGEGYQVVHYQKGERGANMEIATTKLGAAPAAEVVGKAILTALEGAA